MVAGRSAGCTAVHLAGRIAVHLPGCIAVHSQVGCIVVENNWEGIRGVVEQTFVGPEDNSGLDILDLGIQELDSLESVGLVPDSQVLDNPGIAVVAAVVDMELEVLVSHDMELVMDRFGLDLESELSYALDGLEESSFGL
jgi:hypothetical protein